MSNDPQAPRQGPADSSSGTGSRESENRRQTGARKLEPAPRNARDEVKDRSTDAERRRNAPPKPGA